MSKSNIALAIVAGAVIGGIVALVLRTEKLLEEAMDENDDEEYEPPRFEKIAGQFSDRISSEMRKAEDKIKSAVRGEAALRQSGEESGVFL